MLIIGHAVTLWIDWSSMRREERYSLLVYPGKMSKGLLIIPSSTNGNSLLNVLTAIVTKKGREITKLPEVDTILFLETSNMMNITITDDEPITYELGLAYREIQKRLNLNNIEIRYKKIQSEAEQIPDIIGDAIREIGLKDKIIIDLTTGKKEMTGSLYTAGTLSGINNMVYVDVQKDKESGKFYSLWKKGPIDNTFQLRKFQPLKELQTLAFSNDIEFVFYKENINSINNHNDVVLNKLIEYFSNAVRFYFSNDMKSEKENLSSCVRNIGMFNEKLIGIIYTYFEKVFDETKGDVGTIGKEKNTIIGISMMHDIYEYMIYSKNPVPMKIPYSSKAPFKYKKTNKDLPECQQFLNDTYQKIKVIFDKMPTLSYYLETLRIYRNRKSHTGNSDDVDRIETKLLLDINYFLLKSISQNDVYQALFCEEKETTT